MQATMYQVIYSSSNDFLYPSIDILNQYLEWTASKFS